VEKASTSRLVHSCGVRELDTSLAHAELNALAKLRWGSSSGGRELWTTLQPWDRLGACLADVERVASIRVGS
jgi:hypothetical protein